VTGIIHPYRELRANPVNVVANEATDATMPGDDALEAPFLGVVTPRVHPACANFRRQ